MGGGGKDGGDGGVGHTHARAHTHTGMSERKEIHTHFLRVVSVQINNILSFCESCLPSCWFALQSGRYNPPTTTTRLLSSPSSLFYTIEAGVIPRIVAEEGRARPGCNKRFLDSNRKTKDNGHYLTQSSPGMFY